MEMRVPLGQIAAPSTEIAKVLFEDLAGRVAIRYEFERGDDRCASGIVFDGVRAYRRRAESHCTRWHMADVYDTVAEIEDSEWLAELTAAMKPENRGLFEMHHFMIYLDSKGCYEVVAQACEFLPEEVVE